jgi:hypothetical protein
MKSFKKTAKIVLAVEVISDFGINIDVQPEIAITNLSVPEQQAIVEEAIRSLEHYIIMINDPTE